MGEMGVRVHLAAMPLPQGLVREAPMGVFSLPFPREKGYKQCRAARGPLAWFQVMKPLYILKGRVSPQGRERGGPTKSLRPPQLWGTGGRQARREAVSFSTLEPILALSGQSHRLAPPSLASKHPGLSTGKGRVHLGSQQLRL